MVVYSMKRTLVCQDLKISVETKLSNRSLIRTKVSFIGTSLDGPLVHPLEYGKGTELNETV